MDNQPNSQKSIKETSTSSTPIIPETQVPDNIENPISTITEVSTSETELSPSQPETLPQPEPEIEETKPTGEYQNEYQDILNQYAANQETIEPIIEPENETPVAPIIPDSNIIPSPPQNNLFKIIFIISLIIFILTATVLAFVYFKNQKGSPTINNQTSTTENLTPTTSPGTCFLNDKTYQTGETFTATDGCNTCTCVSQNNISCTDKECLSSKSATESAANSTKTATSSSITKDWKTYTGKLFSFKYPSNWIIKETEDNIIIKNNTSETFTIYFSPIGRGFEEVTSFVKYDASLKNNLITLSNKIEKTSKTLETASGDITTKGYAITTTADKYTFTMEGINISGLTNGVSSFEQILNSFKLN